MNINTKKILIGLGIALIITLLCGLLYQIGLIQRWENQVNDILYRDFQIEQHPSEAVIIAIDQNSLDYFQKNFQVLWPWPRDIYAMATNYLNSCGAKVILYDIIFSTPDIDRLNVQAEYADSVFAREMRTGGNVVLAMQMEDSTHLDAERLLTQFNRRIVYNVPQRIVHKYPNVTAPIDRFQKAMAYPGAVNFFTDNDGVCRQVPLLFAKDDRIVPYMALAAVLVYDDISTVDYDSTKHTLVADKRHIPIKSDGFYDIYWYGPGGAGNTFQYVSFAQILNSYLQMQNGQKPDVDPVIFKDKAVFIGATAAGLLDLKTTPYSSIEPYPGVEIYATIFSNIIRGDYISDFPFFAWLGISIVLIWLLAFLWQKLKIWQSVAISLIILFIPLMSSVVIFQRLKMFVPVVATEIAFVLSITVVLLVNYLTEGREKKMIKKVFNRYLHPTVVEVLTKNPKHLEMGGQEIVATVMFSDLQNFTGIAETFTPSEIVGFLNQYFTRVEQIIFENNGMLDKYTGDGIMAIFGAPIPTNEHARMACNAALGFKKLANFTIEVKNRAVPLITRLGINSGNFVVGNIGSANRMDYTAIGDTVNLAARLEGVNKIYGTQNIISETTYALVKENFICRELDLIRVKGRQEPLAIYNVICIKDDLNSELRKMLELYNEALRLYRKCAFQTAEAAFLELNRQFPDDSVSQVFAKRCIQLINEPHLIDADGVFNITVK
ncbi:MAG TPA: adenylate/guanylate cyclase domain-containing protein [Candidatus Marinimicrobia bacterium]|nr:adenylate/guanylate cyclase domain-containing protein [Candidatus Neomarinimicrobiota bacterium]HRS51185.1 adenylate/guanylate cyclase domain-containing protein [Candidatus Neomarinimicrobiota bacterium]